MSALPRDPVRRKDAGARKDAASRLLVVLFVVYLVLLAWGVLYKFDTWFGVGDVRRVIKLVPFAPGDSLGASEPPEVVANLLLFVPFGVYLGLLAPAWRWYRSAVVIAGASVVLEITQYVLAIGNTDITDVIVNTAGGLVGLGILALVRRRLGERTVPVMTWACLVAMVIAVLAVAAFVVSPIRYGPPHGGHTHRLSLDQRNPMRGVEHTLAS